MILERSLRDIPAGVTQGLPATLVADTSPPELRGTAYGFFNLLGGFTMLAASVIAGSLWDAGGARMTFLTVAGFSLVALIGLLAVEVGSVKELRRRWPDRDFWQLAANKIRKAWFESH